MSQVFQFTTTLAQELSDKGYRVIPVYEKSPAKFGANQSYPPSSYKKHWHNAVAVGVALDRVILVDFDGHKCEGTASFQEVADCLGLTLEELQAAQVQTNDEGTSVHWWFRWPDDFDLDSIKQSNTGETLKGIDFKTKNQLSNFKPSKKNSVPRFEDLPLATPEFEKIFAKKTHNAIFQDISIAPTYTNQTTPYGRKALDNILNDLAACTENRNVTLNKSAYSIGRLISGGEIAEVDAVTNLENVAMQLLHDEPASVKPTIKSGLEAGKKEPYNKKVEDFAVKELTNEIHRQRDVLKVSKQNIAAAKSELDQVKIARKETAALLKEVKAQAKIPLATDDDVEAQKHAVAAQERVLEVTKQLDAIKKEELIKAQVLSDTKQARIDAQIAANEAARQRDLIRPIFNDQSPDSEIINYVVNMGMLDNVARDDHGSCFLYDGFKWSDLCEIDYRGYFAKDVIPPIFEGGYNNSKLNAISRFALSYLGEVPSHKPGFVGFSNGVLNVNTLQLLPHHKSFGLSSCNSFAYSPDEIDCPNFTKWIEESARGETAEITQERLITVMAALYMIMTNRYDWQKYIEVVGEGGTGKSIFVKVCEMLTANPISTTMDMLECTKSAHGLEPLLGASLIVVPDAKQYVGDMNNVKAITGNDSISINPKNRKMITLSPVPACLIITANQPMLITDKSTGVWRRRVVIYFNNVVQERDYELASKLRAEKVAIFNMVASFFETPDDAKAVLEAAINNSDKIKAVIETDPLYSWVAECVDSTPLAECRVGGKQSWVKAKSLRGKAQLTAMKTEAQTRLYSSYLLYCDDHSINHPLSQKVFSTKLMTVLSTLGYKDVYHKKPKNVSIISGISLSPTSQSINHIDDMITHYHVYHEDPLI